MKLYIDLDTLTLITGPSDRRPVSRLDLKRGDHTPFEIRFLRGGIPERLAATNVLTFAAKPLNEFDSSPVTLEAGFAQSTIPTPPELDSDPHWTGAPSFNTVELNALFGIDGAPENDPLYVEIMAEFTWIATGDSGPTTSRTFTIRVLNDVFRGDEGTPLALPSPEEWLAQKGPGILLPAGISAYLWRKPEVFGASVNWDEFCFFLTTKTSANQVLVTTSTGYARVIRWDGTLGTVKTTASYTNVMAGSTMASPYTDARPKLIGIFSCNSAGLPAGQITGLHFYSFEVTAIDLSRCTGLTELNVQANNLSVLDVSHLTSLTNLNCSENSLRVLDVSQLTSLTNLDCTINNLSVLDVSALTALTSLDCSDNNLSVLDVSALTALTALYCQDNNLSVLDVSQLTALTELDCSDNNLSVLDVSALTALTGLGCSQNNLAVLDVGDCSSLQFLYCSGNAITALDVSAMSGLQDLNARDNWFGPAEVDQIFNDLAAILTAEYGDCDLSGTSEPTAASASSIAYLIGSLFWTLVYDV